MSGGVDSSVCAALLVEQGYDVFGIMLRLWSEPGEFATTRDNRCCTRDQMIDATIVARKLGIPFELIDAQEVFHNQVVEGFLAGYAAGITPNPCLSCNRHIRFTYLLNEALSRGATHLATGHYARVRQAPDGSYQLLKGMDSGKDQSYVLSVLNQEQLSHAMFPVGEYDKPQVRDLAARFGLRVASKSESQDLCFVADGDYRRFIHDHIPEAVEPGTMRLVSGEVIGTHTGLPNYTIGQRKGLGISWPEPLYVVAKTADTNEITVGPRAVLGRDQLRAIQMNWLDGIPPSGDFDADVKTRYKSMFVRARVTPEGMTAASVHLYNPVDDLTPGQGVILYDEDRVLGGGIISSVN
jgi:tRNA-specific 2-thiouridylase